MPTGGNFTSCNCGPDTEACESPTQPVATVGLCLADGTPIAVAVVRDCSGTVTSEGWINLTTGAWSAGPPPAGTVACGDSRSIQVSGVFCDVDPDTGDVLGLVLVEYSYAADGSIDEVRLVDAVTGDTYVPEGEVTTCPAGVEQPERDLVQLCDETEDEAGAVVVTPFVRDYTRDENGQITGYTDYDLDGAPYTPAGEVGVCQPTPAEECRHCETLTLCDLRPDESPGDPEIVYETIPLAELPPAGSYGDGSPVSGTLPNGVGYTVNVGEWLEPQGHYTFYPYDGTQLWTFTEPVYLRFGLRGLNITPTECYILPEGAVAESINPNHTWNPANRQLCEITGQSSATDESVFTLGPVTELPIVPSGSDTGGRGPGLIQVGLPMEEPAPEGTPHPFLRTVCRGCDGETVSTVDTTLDGEPYAPVGEVTTCGAAGGDGTSGADLVDCDDGRALLVRVCESDEPPGEPEPCRNASTLLLCDLPPDETDGSLVAADTTPLRDSGAVIPLAGGGAALWSGGTLTFPEDEDASETDGQQAYRAVAATLQADRPTCDDGTATVTASVHVVLDGPSDAVGIVGRMSLYAAGVELSTQAVPMGVPVGYESTLTVSAAVSADAVAAGDVVVELWLETFHVGPKSWTVDEFTAGVTFDRESCAQQFLRTVVTDCETGDTVSVTDTTLGGEPYDVQGEVGQCQTAGGDCCEQPPPVQRMDVETDTACIIDAEGETGARVVVERVYDDQTAELVEIRLSDPTTGDPVELPDGATLGQCGGEEHCLQHLLEECRWDDTDGDGVGDTGYVELIAVDGCTGDLTVLGTYTDDLTGPYDPVSPVDPPPADDDTAQLGVQAHRLDIPAGSTWTAAGLAGLQSVTATAHAGTGTITTDDGDSTLHEGESVTWSVVRDQDAALTGPLVIATVSGVVTVAWTTVVTL